jgi:N-acetylglutamate synthase-like GNAT family acetyltransferase
MNTRKLETSDAPIARSLVKQFHGRDVSTEYMAKWLGNAANYLLIAEAGGQVVGRLSAHAIDSLEREATAIFIYEIDVEADYRRRGVGAALIAHIRQIADEQKMFETFVLTNHSNVGAVAFYHATGGEVEEGDELMFVYPRRQDV